MTAKRESTALRCHVCGRALRPGEAVGGALLRDSIAEMVRKEHPGFSPESVLCSDDLNRYRARYVEKLLQDEKGELDDLELEVIRGLRNHELLSENVNEEFETERTFGERLADRVATFGGSWTFILLFAGFLLVWVAVNSLFLLRRPFDPYPYILLNLFLSCLAAIQAPIIMMSQNRQDAKDRLRSENDYQVNLKSELEVRLLSERIDRLLTSQWSRLLEIQQIQVELMEEIGRRSNHKRRPSS